MLAPYPSLFPLALAYPASLFDVHVWTYQYMCLRVAGPPDEAAFPRCNLN